GVLLGRPAIEQQQIGGRAAAAQHQDGGQNKEEHELLARHLLLGLGLAFSALSVFVGGVPSLRRAVSFAVSFGLGGLRLLFLLLLLFAQHDGIARAFGSCLRSRGAG